MQTQALQDVCPNCGTDLTVYMALPTPPAFCLQCKFPLKLVAGKYQLQHVLGEGGFGTVYLARHVRLARNAERVVKLIKPEVFGIDGMEKRFYREVQLTSDLSQRNEHIVRIYDDFGEEKNLGHYYVMEFLQGRPLLDYVTNPSTLPEVAWSLEIFRQLCEAMQAAHEEGIIHRDLKPENILLISRRKHPYFLKVLDFGIAKPTQAGPEATKLTQGALGTPYYMSPEQTMNRDVDNRSDIYSMGIMLFEMLTGRHPFIPKDRVANISAMELMSAHMMQELPDPRESFPERRIPEGVAQAILKAGAKEPADRFSDVEEFWRAIAAGAGVLARTKPEDLPRLLPNELRNTPSESLRKAAPSAFARTAGPEELNPGALASTTHGPRSTPGTAASTAHMDISPSSQAAGLPTGQRISGPSSSVRPSPMSMASVSAHKPPKKRRLLWWALFGLLLGGVGIGMYAGELFSTTANYQGSQATDPSPRRQVPSRPVARPKAARAPAKRPAQKKAPAALPDASPRPAKRPKARKPPVSRRPRKLRRTRKRRRKPRRRVALRPKAPKKKAGSGCPVAGWVRLKISPCTSSRGIIEVSGAGLPKNKRRGQDICVPPGRSISIDQSGCNQCIFKVPATPPVRNIYLKSPDQVDIDTGQACLRK